MLRAAVSFSTNKLSKIIEEIRDDADQIEKLAPLIEARKAKGERQDMLLERTETRLERVEAQKERQAARAWREDNEGDRQGASSSVLDKPAIPLTTFHQSNAIAKFAPGSARNTLASPTSANTAQTKPTV